MQMPAKICIERQIVRTTLNIDDEALEAALKADPGKTKTAVINDALRDYARRRALRGLRKLAGKVGWSGDLDALRKRKPRPS
ncbi:MAG: type II toxin-antitoxin system VapB family antitoxin [Acidobacteria bacterium]|nr:type II toxin-antitoxin system VapB family antitoxin [Acidobacteriota bacterium]